MCIVPNAVRRPGSPLDRAGALANAAVTRTGSKLTVSPFPGPSSPCRYCLHQPNTWLAFTPCARATRATEAPDASVSSTMRRFCSTVRRRRSTGLSITARFEVSTYPPKWTPSQVPTAGIIPTYPHFVQTSLTVRLPFVLTILGLVWRLFDEEKFLAQNLPGYSEYCAKVHWHLIPGIF
jgi:hypothetical protein